MRPSSTKIERKKKTLMLG
jgi:hypothetical protein